MADAKPRCRLYLQVPAPLTAKLESHLAQAIANTSAACVLFCDSTKSMDETQASRLMDLVQAANVAGLVENDAALAERLGADGLHIDGADPEAYGRARDLLGDTANIGVNCGADRHDAMRLAELGADYVAFEAGSTDGIDQCTDIIAWWAEIFLVPCVAWNVDDPEQAARLAGLGADFVTPSRSIWQGDDPGAALAAIDGAIGRVRRAA